MTCGRYLGRQSLGLVTAVVMASFAVAIAAIGQDTSAELPAKCSNYSSLPLPAEAERAPVPNTTPACDSYRSYRGIGRPVNYGEARACAWRERLAQKAQIGQPPVVGGRSFLPIFMSMAQA